MTDHLAGKKKKNAKFAIKKITIKPIKLAALIMVALIMVGSVALVLVEKFAPEQAMIPQRLVSLPSTVVSFLMKPFQGVFSWISNGAYNYLERQKLRGIIEMEYNALRARNEELAYQVMLLEQLQEERDELLEVWNPARSQYVQMEMNPILATVTARNTGNWFQKFTIDVGSNQDVKVNMAVVNDKGLIGYIDTVTETTAEVLTIIDSRAGVAGSIRSTGDQGMIHGTLGIENEPTCRMFYLPVDLVPRPGDIVETSGIGMPFPKGIPIGEVRESTLYMDQNKHYVVVEPVVDFRHLRKVIVLIYEPAKEDIPQGNDGQIAYISGALDTMRPMPTFGESIEDPYIGSVTPPPRVTRAPSADDEQDDDLDEQEAMFDYLDIFYTPDPEFDVYMDGDIIDRIRDGGDN